MTPVVYTAVANAIDVAQQLRLQDSRMKQAISCAEVFLRHAYPGVPGDVVENLCSAIQDLLCCGTEEQIAAYEQHQGKGRSYEEEYLVNLVKQRDAVSAQLEQASSAVGAMREKLSDGPMAGAVDLWDGTMVLPLRHQLESIEEQISQSQRRLEALQSANAEELQPASELAEERENKKPGNV